jgi:hypothetical protein
MQEEAANELVGCQAQELDLASVRVVWRTWSCWGTVADKGSNMILEDRRQSAVTQQPVTCQLFAGSARRSVTQPGC